MKQEFHHLRVNYNRSELLESQAGNDPMALFQQWFAEAIADEVEEPNAMVLSTVGLDGFPNSRVVLLKELTAQGFIFYTNFQSQKGQEIAAFPHVSLVFNWLKLQRQVRVRGHVSRLSSAEAETYFATRPVESQLGAWASDQSEIVESRDALEERYRKMAAQFAHQPIPKPPHWGGYAVEATELEFWQGREGRLHDRLQFTQNEGAWVVNRLMP